ncbi:MAG: hypothetical protein U5K69_12250 [Balneolaceae bacterium]|nr:hypothetical protein [Balneolaceae bacterium]
MGTHYKGTDEEKATLNAFIKMTRASESINTRLNRHLADADITVSQFGVLEALTASRSVEPEIAWRKAA